MVCLLIWSLALTQRTYRPGTTAFNGKLWRSVSIAPAQLRTSISSGTETTALCSFQDFMANRERRLMGLGIEGHVVDLQI